MSREASSPAGRAERPSRPALALLVALPIVAVATLAARAIGPLEYALFPDDALYYLCVGRNLADGLGPTFDGVNPTTGFQPLWQAMVALVALGPFDETSLLTAVAAVNLACIAAAAVAIAIAFERRGLRAPLWIAATLIALGNPYLLKTSLNGMESGLVWLSWSLVIIVLTRLLEGWTDVRAAATAGVVGGFVLLSRLDGGPLVLALTWVVASSATDRRARALVAFFGAMAAVIGPYFAWMLIRFGHWLPVSVLVKTTNTKASPVVLALIVLAFAAAVVWIAGRRFPAAMRAALLALCAGMLPLVTYGLISPIRLSHVWYYPGALVAGLTLATLVASAWWTRGRRGLVVAGIIVGLAFAAGAWALRLSVSRSDQHYRVADAIGRRLRQTLAPDVRIAGWNVGLVAYRRSCRVTNLDGLVNSYDYLDALLGRRVVPWLDAQGIDGIVDWFVGDPFIRLAERDPRLPARLTERFRIEYEHVSAMALRPAPRSQVFIYFDYRRTSPLQLAAYVADD